MKNSRSAVSLATALLLVASAGIANASMIEASFYTPYSYGNVVAINLTGITTPSQDLIKRTDYAVSFTGVDADQGVVKGWVDNRHAVPVAGVTDANMPTYLTGGFGSDLTPTIGDSGNYFSTGTPGSITFTFAKAQNSFALLWGSVDPENLLTFSYAQPAEFAAMGSTLAAASSFTVSGAELGAVLSGLVPNGFQGPGGSAYVVINPGQAFNTVTASSGVVSFEFAGVAASSEPFTVVPEPSTFGCLLGIGIGIVAMRRRLHFR